MRTLNLYILAFFVLLFSACSSELPEVRAKNTTADVPKMLTQSPNSLSESYGKLSSSRGQVNFVDKLYAEVLEENKDLEQLSKLIQTANENASDSLIEYRRFISNTKKFTKDAHKLLATVEDSILRKNMEQAVARFESSTNEKLQQHYTEFDSYLVTKKQVREQEIMLKLLISLHVMQNYTNTEKPNIQTLKQINTTHNALLKDIKSAQNKALE